jgi:alpha/beta superfamily hydrolase
VAAAVRDEVELFGGPEAQFACRHAPGAPHGHGSPPAAVLVCPSVGPGAAASYGAEARLGRALAGAGLVAQRFHYRGTGASDGSPRSVDFAALVADARAALDLVRRRTGAERVGLVGVRLGALVAARLASTLGDAPVALWAPVVEPGHFVEQAVRGRRAVPAARSATAPPDGHVVSPSMFEMPLVGDLVGGAAVCGLVDEIGARRRDVLVVRTAVDAALDAAHDPHDVLAAQWRARGLDVETVSLPCDGERDGVPVPQRPAGALVEHTTAWLAARLSPPAAPGDGPLDPDGGT